MSLRKNYIHIFQFYFILYILIPNKAKGIILLRTFRFNRLLDDIFRNSPHSKYQGSTKKKFSIQFIY